MAGYRKNILFLLVAGNRLLTFLKPLSIYSFAPIAFVCFAIDNAKIGRNCTADFSNKQAFIYSKK
jgi:hypothetical protein